MQRREDEQSIGARNDSLVRVFEWSNQPPALRKVFKDLWQERIGQYKKADDPKPTLWLLKHSWDYQNGLYLALEHLRRASEIPDSPVFDESGRLRTDASESDVRGLFGKDGILKGKRVVVFGGPEAEVFQAMGAQAVGYDPSFAKKEAKQIQWKARQIDAEIEELLENAEGQDNGWADFTYSSSLFDPGSGLVEDAGRYAYTMNLWVVLNLTKVGGLSIHDGNGMLAAVFPNFDGWQFGDKTHEELEKNAKKEFVAYKTPASVVEIAPDRPDAKVGDSETIYVLKRLGEGIVAER